MSKWLQLYIEGGMPKWLQYYIGGGLGTPKSDYVICARPLIFIWERGPFLFALFPVVARTWLESRSVFLAQKLGFCHTASNFVNGLLADFGKTVRFAPWDQFFYFLCPCYVPFRKKDDWRTKKSSLTPLWGHRLSVTALALSARRLDKNYSNKIIFGTTGALVVIAV